MTEEDKNGVSDGLEDLPELSKEGAIRQLALARALRALGDPRHGHALPRTLDVLSELGLQWIVEEWRAERLQLRAANSIFHLDSVVKSLNREYALPEPSDLQSIHGLLRYAADVANMKAPSPPPPDKTSLDAAAEVAQLLHNALYGPSTAEEVNFSFPSEEHLLKLREAMGEGLMWWQRLERGDEGAAIQHHAYIRDAEAFGALVAMLLLDKSNRELIRQCKYAPCNLFFVAEKGTRGRPQLYHSDKCRTEANDADSAVRQAAARTRRGAEQILMEWDERPPSRDALRRFIKEAFKAHPDATDEQLAKYTRALIRSSRKRK